MLLFRRFGQCSRDRPLNGGEVQMSRDGTHAALVLTEPAGPKKPEQPRHTKIRF
jgi:hypothetical protein